MEEGGQAQAAQIQPSGKPGQDDILRQQLSEILGDILMKAQELGFELATLDYGEIGRCPAVKPLIEKSRELIMSLKRLFALRRALEK